MTHYTVTFDGPTKQARDEQALKEVKTYLGASGMRRLNNVTRMTQVRTARRSEKYRTGRIFCEFNGIRGYHPVRAVCKIFLEMK